LVGNVNVALVPIPSTLPEAWLVLPANVVTDPSNTEIFRMAWFAWSATYRLPARSMTMPRGPLYLADALKKDPAPAAVGGLVHVPENVVTLPAHVDSRMQLFNVSAIKILLVPDTYTLYGALKPAKAPTSFLGLMPPPTNGLTRDVL
jgi:hypothetical protein